MFWLPKERLTMMEIRSILAEAVRAEASDVHLNVGMRPVARIETLLDAECINIEAQRDAWT